MARLLLADHDPANSELLSRMLSGHGYAFECAENGQQALDLLTGGHFDLVLLSIDVVKPPALELLRRIRQTWIASELPVILVAPEERGRDVAAALRLGANDCITWPADSTVAVARIEARMSLANVHRELRRSRELYQLASRAAEGQLWERDLDTAKPYSSPDDGIYSGFEEWLGAVHPDDQIHVAQQFHALIEGEIPRLDCEYRLRQEDGRYRWIENRASVSRDSRGKALRIAGYLVDVTARKTVDPLTALPNRAGLLEELQTVCDGAAILLLFDLDGFDRLEVTLPVEEADHLLTAVAQRIRNLAGSAPSGVSALAAHPALHQFAILLRGNCPLEETAAGMRTALQAPFLLQGRNVFVTATVGIAMDPGGAPGEGLLRDAMAAVRQGHEHGTGRCEVFEEGMRGRDSEAVRLENDLRLAVKRSEFVVHYQPKVDLESGEIEGFEALVRWNRPGFGLVQPSDFIPAAERTGLIVPIGRMVLESACRDTAELRRSFPRVIVSVNVSGRQFEEPDLVEQVRQCLSRAGLPSSALRLEVTETFLIESPAAGEMLREFREMGVQLKLDDFGSGYSSFLYLKQFPFDVLKIDRSFTAGLAESPENVAIVRTIIALARSLRLTVVAEGIETREQLDTLRSLGCHYGQGFWFSKPVDLRSLRKLLSAGDHARVAGVPPAGTMPVPSAPGGPADLAPVP